MCSRVYSGDSASRSSQTLFDYVLQQRQEFREHQHLHQQQQQHEIAVPHHQPDESSSAANWSSSDDDDDGDDDDDDEKQGMVVDLHHNDDSHDHHRGHLKRSMSRRGAIGFACSLTKGCIETANYFYENDNPSDDSFVPMQKPPERSESSAKKRCRLGRTESSGSHQRHLDDATDQFAAVAISDELLADAEAEEMERSVRRKMHMEEFSSSQHTINDDLPDCTIDTSGHYSVRHLLQKQPSFWGMENELQRSNSDRSTVTMDDL